MIEKILLDTDIGSDIDDAVCLAYLLMHPRCELLGITTVTGEAEERAKMTSAICRQAGRTVPVYPGAVHPIIVEQKQPRAPQAEKLGAWPHDTVFPRGEAVEFLRRTIRAHPGQVTLLSIGPLTNLGLLFSVDPEIPGLLKALVMMCGMFHGTLPGYLPVEWNASGDPHASAIVYRSAVRVHRSIGLDVTHKVSLSAEEFRSRGTHTLFAPILDFAEVWFREWPGTTFHDPLAAATIFDDTLCGFERGTVSIDLAEGPSLGTTLWKPSADGPHEVARSVDVMRFSAHSEAPLA